MVKPETGDIWQLTCGCIVLVTSKRDDITGRSRVVFAANNCPDTTAVGATDKIREDMFARRIDLSEG